MDILIVAPYFPPNAPVAATRIGKLARYFVDRGHGVRVLTAHNPRFPALIPREIPDTHVSAVPFPDINDLPERMLGKLWSRNASSPESTEAAETAGGDGAAPPAKPRTWKSRLGGLYRSLVNIPDNYVGWRRPALAEGRRLIGERRPDLIYASMPPHSGLMVAGRLGREFNIPVVAEYRDLWVAHPYYDAPFWRRFLETRLEKRCSKAIAAYVTVTREWADWLRKSRGKPTALVYNGFDPADFADAPPDDGDSGDKLNIVYAGALYGDKRDPTPLFEALQKLGDRAGDIRVVFHTPEPANLSEKIEAYGLKGIVDSRPAIAQRDVLTLEQTADILLLLRWDHPSEKSVVAGKLFEYIGAGRPILSVGLEDGEAADIIRENGFGLVSKDRDVIADGLRTWLAEKRESGRIAGIDPAARQTFTRRQQFDKLAAFLADLRQDK